MNIRDSYIHGADGRGVVKSLFFVTAADVQSDANLVLNDLGVTLADAVGTTFYLTIPTLNLNTTGYAALILTESKTNNSNYYLTFVGSNNTNGAAALSVYTNVNMYFNPGEGPTGHKGTLHVNNISGDNIGITIGNTFVALGGTYTPATSITSSSDNNSVPGCKAVWDAILAGMKANDAMIFMGFLTGGADAVHTAYTPAAERGDTYKVSTAGYINGSYYQVNDTFICTTDSTAQATSSNVSTVKANWGVVEGNGDYLNYNGGTMFGALMWNDLTTALPESTTAARILLAEDGDNSTIVTKYITLTNLKAALDVLDSNHTHTVKINNSDKVIYITGGTVTDLGSYLPLSGGTMNSGALIVAGSITNSSGARYNGGIQLRERNYQGKNLDGTVYSDGPAITFHWSGRWAHILNMHSNNLCWDNSIIAHSGNTSSENTTIGTTLTKIATIAGVEIKAQIGSYLPSDHVYPLSIAAAATTDTNQITLAASTKYKLTAGGSMYVFTTPTDTWRNIYIGGSSKVGTGSDTKAMNFASSNLNITYLAAGTSTGLSGNANYFTIGIEAKNWTGATSNAAGTAGYMPGATSANRLKYLRGDGSWIALAPSISTGTEDTKKIKITVGEESSNEYLVPYANQAGNADTLDNYHADDILPYGLENLCIGITAGGARATLSNGVITTNGTNGDTYFYVQCSEDLTTDQIYTVGFYVTGVPSGGTWDFPFSSLSNSNLVVHIDKNGWCWGTGTVILNFPAGTNIIFDDINKSFFSPITISKVVIVKGKLRAYYSPAISKMRVDYANSAGAVTWENITSKPAAIGSETRPVFWNGSTFILANEYPTKASWNYDDMYVKLAWELVRVTKTLKVTDWESMVAINTLDAGTYAIQINSGTVYASGVFTACHGTDSVIDEIPLHVTDSASTNTWRPYARISGTNLQMTTNELTGTSREYTIKIVKLI